MPKTYTIRTIADLAQIPDDRLSDFFDEIKESFIRIREQQKFVQMLTSDVMGSQQHLPELGEITWTDDGKRNMESVFQTSDGAPAFTIKVVKRER